MPAVFISYSRKDFYFAESLAFHLTERGIESWLDANHLTPGGEWGEEIDRALDEAQTIVLVATPASVRSPYVQREWKRALAQGDRLIVALFRSCKLPPEMSAARVVDFRGRFGAALQRLTGLLGERRDASAPLTKTFRAPRVPPWIALMTLMLASVFLFPMIIFLDWQDLNLQDETIGFRIFAWIMLPFIFGLVAWHACLAFLWRRMGLRRLAFTLALFTGIFGFVLLGRSEWIPAVTKMAGAMHYKGITTFTLMGIVGTGCFALAIVILFRPEDLLRWCPTGKAWDAYRRGRVMKIPDLPTRFAQLGRFQLLHDVEDAPAAARLRSDLISLGAIDSPGDGKRVILLTNRTTTVWLGGQAELLQKGALPVIGSAIGLPESLHWLWRRQWIDLRRWDATRKQGNPVPAVPEGMALLRLPASVRVSEHLLCAIAGLLAVLANVVFPPETSNNDALTPRDAFGVVLAIACVLWIVGAWQLIHRTITQARYRRGAGILAWLTVLLAGGGFYFFVSLGNNGWRAVPAILFVVALPFLLRWQTPRLAFWFPAPPLPVAKTAPRLNAPRKWDALLWTFLYMGLWMVLLGLMD
jgi:hypothetical protein